MCQQMYEGRTRAAELTEELKTTHGLQEEDRARIAKEEAKARDYNAVRSEVEKKVKNRQHIFVFSARLEKLPLSSKAALF